MIASTSWQGSGAKACVVVAILLVSAALRFHQMTLPVIWLDEAFSVLLSRLSPEAILFHTARDVHPPLYYLILHYWMQVFGSDALGVRSLSACAGIATVGVGMLLTRQLASWRAAFMAGVLMAFFPMGIRYSQEARMYALLGLLLMTAVYMLWLWVSRQRKVYLVAYCLLMVAALYTHYFAVLGALANWVYLSLTRDAQGKVLAMSRAWWVGHVAMVVAYLPWLPTLYRQMDHRELVGWIVFHPTTVMSVPRSFMQAFTMSKDAALAGMFGVLLSIPLLLASLRVLRRASKPGQPDVLLLSYCFVPVLVVWLVSYAMPIYIDRYLLFALLALPLVVAIAADASPKRTLLLSVVGCLLIELTGLAYFYDYQAKPGGDLATVMAQVNEQWRAGDALLSDRKRSYLSIEYYNDTGQPAFLFTGIQPDTTGKAATTYGTLTLFYRRSDVLYVANPQDLAKHYKRLWLITDPSSAYTPQVPVDGWVKVGELVEGSTKALLFAVPEQANR
jgi:4-amino-4-deoxy-L-arabinose transferase-like glycosyltransferase